MHDLTAAAVGVFAGLLSGLLGVTPGGILVPGLTLVFGGSQHQVQAMSLVAQLFPTSLAGFHVYRRAGHAASIRAIGLVALGFLPGSYLGAKGALLLSDQVLRWAFVGYLVVLVLSVAAKGSASERSPQAPGATSGNARSRAFVLVAVGVAAGASSGLLGIGGGLAMVVLLTVLLSMPQHESQAISLAVSAMPLALPAVFVYVAGQGGLPWMATAFVVAGLLLGTLAGARIATRFAARALRRYFLVLIAVMALLMAGQALGLAGAAP